MASPFYESRQTATARALAPSFPAWPTVWTITLALAASLAVWASALAAFSRAGRPGALDDPANVAYPLVAIAAYGAMAAVLVRRWRGLTGTPASAIGLRRPGLGELATIAAGAACVCSLRLLTFAYLSAIGQAGHVQSGLGGFRPAGPLAVALVIAAGAIAAPFAEELLFRGVVYRALAQRMPQGKAGVASGLIFAATRFDVVLAPFFVLYGTLLAAVYRRTGNLLVPIGIRALFDGASYTLLVWLAAAKP